ncbi:hypothetical protein KUTeg_005084 [Tegillarca granosa]|uniref:Uncharacterized protein n=1 Tax=Tegillarca granosa TaxID=220873 RepID=A0ABQ9FIS4_TEGGR|nr:hypothetical protein KUTeg_005084 [Tegillarca granosa]
MQHQQLHHRNVYHHKFKVNQKKMLKYGDKAKDFVSEDVFVLDPKCQQIKELYSNESCALLNIPHHIRTSQTQIYHIYY